MIHVEKQPEPHGFDEKVRQKGLRYLSEHADPELTLELPPYWRDCLDDLYASYNGICAYLSVYINRVTGAVSTDHFIAKSKVPDLAYEWSNFRLACLGENARKNNFDDVLDPFEVKDGWFHLQLSSGHIFPDPSLNPELKTKIGNTIARLALDSYACREMRARHYAYYCDGHVDDCFLKKESPFVYAEALRQHLL